MVTPIYAALLTVMLVVLILRVVRLRIKHRISILTDGNAELDRAVRVHGNFIETAPWLLLLMMFMEIQYTPPVALHIFGILVVLCRVMHAVGLTYSLKVNIGRTGGMILTTLLMIIAAGYNLWLALTSAAM